MCLYVSIECKITRFKIKHKYRQKIQLQTPLPVHRRKKKRCVICCIKKKVIKKFAFTARIRA